MFPRGLDGTLRTAGVGLGLCLTIFVGGFYYYAFPQYTRVGYQPEQPVPYWHVQHVGQLGMDCRYCHTKVEDSPHANVPTTQICMNCHNTEKAHIPAERVVQRTTPLRESWKSGQPIEWRRIHQVPHYAYFNHAIHVQRGVSCVSCHGQINEMKVVWHDQALTMGWCLNCHNHSEEYVRPKDQVTNLTWKPESIGKTQLQVGTELRNKLGLVPPIHCGGCHR